jgi:hypothetical protein
VKLSAVYLNRKTRRPTWVAVWMAPGRAIHDPLPLDPGASIEEARTYALEHPPTGQPRDLWLAERARPFNLKDGNP